MNTYLLWYMINGTEVMGKLTILSFCLCLRYYVFGIIALVKSSNFRLRKRASHQTYNGI